MHRDSPCRSCKRHVKWAKTAATGKAMPLDEDLENGNVLLDAYGKAHAFRDHAAAVAAAESDTVRGFGAATFIAHHAVCPAGAAWRGKKRETETAEPAQGVLL